MCKDALYIAAAIAVAHVRDELVMRRAGTTYGGWWYNASEIDTNTVVYSIGLGTDTSWDEEMIKTHGLQVWGFDPTPKAIAHVQGRMQLKELPKDLFHFTREGLGTNRGTATFTMPRNPAHASARIGNHPRVSNRTFLARINTLDGWMNRHRHAWVDVLKMDVEGSEYDVLEDWIARQSFPMRQLLVEFHQRFERSFAPRHRRVLSGLRANGFVVMGPNGNREVSFQRARNV